MKTLQNEPNIAEFRLCSYICKQPEAIGLGTVPVEKNKVPGHSWTGSFPGTEERLLQASLPHPCALGFR